MITEYRNFVDDGVLGNLWLNVTQPQWRFGQKSNNDTVYPMWVQNFYDTYNNVYNENTCQHIVKVGDMFLDLCPEDYIMVRSMICGNTFGQDGDIHTDWPNLNESITGVLYLNPRWEDNWGGETIVYAKDNLDYCEVSKLKLGKLIVFDGANPHIGKGPQRICGELRCIIAMQAVKTDPWNKLLDSKKQK